MINLGTKFQLEQCLFYKMILVGVVKIVGIFSAMDGKAEKAETQRIAQDMEQHEENCSRKVERYVLIGT